MFDLLIAFCLGAALVWGLQRFASKASQGAPSIPTTLDGFGQILSFEAQAIVKRLDGLEASLNPDQLIKRIETMISDAMTQALADLKAAVAAKIAAAEAPAADAAAVAKDAEDVAAVQAVTADLIAA